MKRNLSFLLIPVLPLFVLMCGTAIFSPEPQRPHALSLPVRSCTNCNLIIITADALRADHMGAYGYHRDTTPNLDRFAEESVLFTNVITPNPKTTPSLATMFTGLHPTQTRVRDVYDRLSDPRIETLAELLKGEGFTTGAVVSNWVLKPRFSKLDRGFDTYNFDFSHTELNRKNIWERDAKKTTSDAIEWLEENANERFFFWVHYIEPHGAYFPPKKYRGRFTHEGEKLVPVSKLLKYQRLPHIPVRKGKTDILSYVDAYDDEIFYFDSQVGRLIAFLRKKGLLENSIVLFGSDHGESMHDHRVYLEHGLELFDDSAHIPLLLHLPSSSAANAMRVSSFLSIADIFPLSLELLGVVPQGTEQKPKSVVSLLDKGANLREYVFIELFRKGEFKQLAVRSSEAKLIRYQRGHGQRFECYNLKKDPREQNPNGCEAGLRQELRSAMTDFLAGKGSLKGSSDTQKPEYERDVKALKNLGYL